MREVLPLRRPASGASVWTGMAVIKTDRDIDKIYPIRDYIAKLRRLADALESGKPFEIQIAREHIAVPADAVYSVEHEREGDREEIEFQISCINPSSSNR